MTLMPKAQFQLLFIRRCSEVDDKTDPELVSEPDLALESSECGVFGSPNNSRGS